jgi:ferredoxin
VKVTVDSELCMGCGDCEYTAPEVFEMNDEGVAVAKFEEVPAEFEDVVQEAADNCPEQAIILA